MWRWKKEDPKTLFEQIASIENWYNEGTQKVPKSQLIAVVSKANHTRRLEVVMVIVNGERGKEKGAKTKLWKWWH